MFLSSSSEAMNSDLDLANAIKGSGALSGIPNAEALVTFTEAVNRRDGNLAHARTELVNQVGVGGMVDAATTISIFKSLNIAADSSGIRLDDEWTDVAADLANHTQADNFMTARNSITIEGNQYGKL